MLNTRWRVAVTVAAGVVLWLGAARAEPQQPTDLQTMTVQAHQPCEVSFAAQSARFVRVLVHRSSANQVCIDELEVYGSEAKTNLALAARGAEASASSCLPGYAIHQVQHLNDGAYGNSHSWIAAQATAQWAQIALPKEELISRVVISRDRDGKYTDRVAVQFDVLLSIDGQHWTTASRVQAKLQTSRPPSGGYAGPYHLSANATWDQKLEYAFGCERHTWSKMSSNDHLSPLQTDRPALPGGPAYWSRIARLDPLSRTLVQMSELVDRLAVKEVDVQPARKQLLELRAQQQQLETSGPASSAVLDQLYLAVRRAKRELMLADPDLEALRRVLFVKRHPYQASHNYSDVLDSTFAPGGGICLLEIPASRRLGCEPSEATVTTLFDASDGIARDPMADFEASRDLLRLPARASVPDPGWEPYWHLMVLSLGTGEVQQLTDGPFHDYYPCPLARRRTLAFISTRVQGTVSLLAAAGLRAVPHGRRRQRDPAAVACQPERMVARHDARRSHPLDSVRVPGQGRGFRAHAVGHPPGWDASGVDLWQQYAQLLHQRARGARHRRDLLHIVLTRRRPQRSDRTDQLPARAVRHFVRSPISRRISRRITT